MKRMVLGAAAAVLLGSPLAGAASAATVIYEGQIYTDIGTPLLGALRQETVGRFFLDPCGDTSDPAFVGCYLSVFRPEDADNEASNPDFEFLWSRPVGMRLFFEVLFTPRAVREEYTHTYTLNVTTGYLTDIGEEEPVVIWSSITLGPVVTATIAAVPLPLPAVLSAAGLGLLALVRRQRRATAI